MKPRHFHIYDRSRGFALIQCAHDGTRFATPRQALLLSEEERAELASSLQESLDAWRDDGVRQAWEEEIARRIEEVDSGKVKAVSWPELRDQLFSRYGNGS